MKPYLLLILFGLLASAWSEPPKLAKLAAPLSLSIVPGSINAPAPKPSFNFNNQTAGSNDEGQSFGSIGEFVYGAIYFFNELAEKQPFWKPDKGLIIPLSIKKNPLQVMPSLDYDSRDNHKNKYTLRACLMF